MRFIRKNGRIIPIKEREEKLKKIDMATGFTVGAVSSLFFKRTKFAMKLGIASAGVGAYTTHQRLKGHKKLEKAVKEDWTSGIQKAGAWATGLAVGAGSIFALNKLVKLRKAKNVRLSIPKN